MAISGKLISVVLVAVMAVAGAAVDLCACHGGDHGLWCAATDRGDSDHGDAGAAAAPVAGAGASAEAEAEAGEADCCSAAVLAVQVAAAEVADPSQPGSAPSAPVVGALPCACPSLAFDAPPANAPSPNLDAQGPSVDLGPLAALPALAGPVAVPLERRWERAPAPPPRSPLRLHLLLCVLLS